MKNLLIILIFFALSFLFVSCEKKDENPTGPGVQFNINPQLNKTYNFQRWLLDSLDQKREGPFYFYEKCAAKNVTVGGKNDAFLSIRYENPLYIDSVYLRAENGKDIYEWMDTTALFEDSRLNLKRTLQKILQSYVWVPRFLLSKGDGAEYVLLPKRFYPIQVDTNLVLNVSFEIVAKNDGFENVTVPAGNYRAYKVKIVTKAEVFYPQVPQPIDKFDFIQYYWISDDLDWWIKSLRPSTKSALFGVLDLGEMEELISTQ